LLLLASLKDRFIYRKLNYFLEVKDEELDILKDNNLADEIVGD